MLTDLEIAHSVTPRPVREIAAEIGIPEECYEPYGRNKGKLGLGILDAVAGRPMGRYVDVTAITPTPLGEGKTVTTVGLGQALKHIGKTAVTCIRQPSLGPVFGIKGGAAGGGYSQVLPMEDMNLHLTGDAHAVTSANNLLAAYIDNHIFHGNQLGIDPEQVTWRRVIDLNDRQLRNVIAGLGGKYDGIPAETGFDITAASEVMAILAMSADLHDMRARIGRIVVAFTCDGEPVTAEQLGCAGAMAVLMKDAIKPNILQNLEGGPVLVHAGPFANIAQGNSSIIADKIGLHLGEYVVTESGFGADMGAEKFVNIKCRASGLVPDCFVIVVTVRGLMAHSGKFEIVPGRDLDPGLLAQDLDVLSEGIPNLEAHIDHTKAFGVPVVVAVNTFPTDTVAEHYVIKKRALDAGADFAVSHDVHARGGAGGVELAEAVVEACEMEKDFRFLYPDDATIRQKIHAVAMRIYGADGVDFSQTAEEKIELFTKLGYDSLPVCMAKSQYSLSHNAALKGRPIGWRLPVRDVRASVGAGFLYPLCADIRTMPGLPARPAGNNIDLAEDGKVVGLH